VPCGEEAGREAGVAAVLGVALAEAGEGEGVVVGEGVTLGGAGEGSVIFTAGLIAASPVSWDCGLTACSSERGGGASRSSSRTAGGVLLEGVIKPPGLALSDRRLILGFSSADLTKLNSPGARLGSGWVAGI